MPEPSSYRILALDLATVSGWAIGSTDSMKPRFGIERFAKRGATPGQVGEAFMVWFSDMTRVEKLDALYVERPMHPSIASKIGTNAETNFILVGLPFLAVTFACARKIPVVAMVDAQDVKASFTGQRRFKDEFDPSAGKIIKSREVGKRATVARCRQLGLDVQDDNAADACALWFHAAGKHNPRIASVTTPLFAGAGQ